MDEYAEADWKMKAAYMIDGWAQGRSDIDTSTPQGKEMAEKFTTDMLLGHNRGATTAGKYLRDTAG
ncbi:hypothetical protein [Streptomyces kebangsaanensis]|uniref:hypothetical protein n=1 Tax=Streptomyces kebangsaanensis TaxID=864058 RepID=UPI0011611D4A|nr:hypothetical protein [Streptomyces kebangsaanensis]